MNYAEIKWNDIANGPGVRISLFVSGCRHHCPGCFNREAWDFRYGAPYDASVEEAILSALAPGYVDGLSLLGGEPFEPENRGVLAMLCEHVKKELPGKSIWCYTGFSFDEELLAGKAGDDSSVRALLRQLDVLVDGRFVEAQKDLSLIFRGSANQRILDVQASLAAGKAVPLPGKWEREMGKGSIYDA